jgi:hypothetical protein
MNVRGKITVIVCVVAGLAILVSAAWAQRVVRIVNGRRVSEPAASNTATEKPAVDPNAVQPVEPTPEEAVRISDLIDQLGDDRLVARDRAMSELAGYEARALQHVRDAKTHDDDEIANRCTLLEEVIMSRQGELFLAARRLNLTIVELNTYLQNEDVTPLLSILRGRAQAGMVPLWARVLARLAGRPQLFPTAELCREIEGTVGYGQALAKAARTPEAAPAANNLLLLMAILPPGDPADTVEAMTQLRFSIGGGEGLEQVLSASVDFRGIYDAATLLAARGGRPEPSMEDQDDAPEVRFALALNMLASCTDEQLNAANLPAIDAMAPLLLSAWLGVLQRSHINGRIESAMVSVLAAGADTRRVSITAAAYAAVAPVGDVIDVFDTVPFEAQLSILDALWLNPREPKLFQPFLIKLLAHEKQGVRAAAAQSLGQYRAVSTAKALLAAALSDAETAPTALAALQRMPELLTPAQLKSLSVELPKAGLLTRPLIAEILVRAGTADALKPLVEGWKTELPRNELPLAMKVLALSPQTAPGAFAAARLADNAGSNVELDAFLVLSLDNGDLELLRSLMAMNDADGFAIMRTIAQDENDSSRLDAMKTLAMAGRDGDLIQDWLKRLAGEIKDPLGTRVGEAIALSLDPAAEEFKRSTLQQGAASDSIGFVFRSVMAGRSKLVTRDQLIEVLFETPESAQVWSGYWELVGGALPPRAAANLATALAFAQGANLFAQPGLALMLADSDVDLLKIMFGDAQAPTPRDQLQLFTTVVLGDPARARTIVEGTQLSQDGSNYVALMIARAWLGLLPGDESRRLRDGVSGNPSNTFGAVIRMERARAGDAGALRVLLDAFGPDSIRFQRGETASMQLLDQQWGSPYMNSQGVASAAHMPTATPQLMGAAPIASLFKAQPPAAWRDWWACRRALLEFDATSGKFAFTELP